MFGEFVKECRMKMNMGLREYCKKYNQDPSNWSKIERGIIPPPKDEKTLELWANQLGIEQNSANWHQFFNLASIQNGKIPPSILKNKDASSQLPLFFRTLEGQKPTREELESLIEFIKRS